jgi:hypothetical protein
LSFFNNPKEKEMGNNNSPLETLAAFAICFVAGVVSTVGMGVYTKWISRSRGCANIEQITPQ